MAQKSPEFQRKLGIYQERMQKGRKIIVDSHIKLGYGTDFVAAYQNYESGMEFRCMMESGMDAFRILQAATKNNAEICEIDSITGTIEKANTPISPDGSGIFSPTRMPCATAPLS